MLVIEIEGARSAEGMHTFPGRAPFFVFGGETDLVECGVDNVRNPIELLGGSEGGFGIPELGPGLEDTSESFGLPATADLMFALISSEELEELGQIMVKQLKNRYSDPTMYKRFTVGIDRAKMRLYDIEQSAQDGLADAGITDKPLNTFGNREMKAKKSFEGFKV